MTARIRLFVLSLVVLVTLTGRASAEPSDDDAKATGRQALIALRILSYDKRLAERTTGSAVTIALVSSATSQGRAARTRFEAGFALMPKVKVGGRPVKIVSLDAGAEKAMETTLGASEPSAVLVVDDLGDKLVPLRTVTRARDILTISLRESDVASGVSVGIVASAERDQIAINLEASRAEGVRFGAGLLQLAHLVDER